MYYNREHKCDSTAWLNPASVGMSILFSSLYAKLMLESLMKVLDFILD